MLLFRRNNSNTQKKSAPGDQQCKTATIKYKDNWGQIFSCKIPSQVKWEALTTKPSVFGLLTKVTIAPFEIEQLGMKIKKILWPGKMHGQSQHFLHLFCSSHFCFLKWCQNLLFPSVGYVSSVCSATYYHIQNCCESRLVSRPHCLLCGHYE